MREIRTSGSTRGQWVAANRHSLSYSTVNRVRQAKPD